MRKAIRLSELMEAIATHIVVEQKPVIGFVLKKEKGKLSANPVADPTPNPNQGMVIFPSDQTIFKMPKSLKGFVELIELLDAFLHIQMDITIAGYVALCIDPLVPSNIISKQHIWMALDSPDELIEIEFTDGSCITISENQLKSLDYAMDLNVVKTVHVLTS